MRVKLFIRMHRKIQASEDKGSTAFARVGGTKA